MPKGFRLLSRNTTSFRMRLGMVLALCLGTFVLLPSKSRGQTTGANDLQAIRQRQEQLNAQMEQLKAQNADLMKQVQHLKSQTPQATLLPTPKQVQKAVDDALKKQADKKKKADEKKKAEEKQKADAKKLEWYPVGSDQSAKVSWKGGRPTFQTANKDFWFQITGRLHMDMGWFNQSAGMPDFQDATAPRRARVGFQGAIWENVYIRTRYDFANPSSGKAETNFRDAFMRIDQLPFVKHLKIGQYKEWLSLSWMSTSNQLPFMERPLPVNAFVPDRNTGISVYRTFADDRIWVGTGFFRNLGSIGAFSQGDGQYAWSSRIAVLSYMSNDERTFVHLGACYSRRSFSGTANNNPRFRTNDEVSIGTPNILDTGQLVGFNDENLFIGEFAGVWGPLCLQSEILGVTLNGPGGVNPGYWGYYAFVSYFLTGENRRYKKSNGAFTTVIPYENFFWMRGTNGFARGIGAWEVLARYSFVDLRSPGVVVPTAANGAGGTGLMSDVTLGVNWYLNPQTTMMFNYIHSWRQSDTPGRDGQVNTAAIRMRFWF